MKQGRSEAHHNTPLPRYIDAERLRALCPADPVTRFAPSPTGHLHLGHVLSLLYVYGVAQLTDAKLLVRIEDHDKERCHQEYEISNLEDLYWLGIRPDNWDSFNQHGLPTTYRQSDNLALYRERADALHRDHFAYYCQCSRKQITPHSPPGHPELRYPGTCRDLQLSDGSDRGLRLNLGDAPVTFDDVIHNQQTQVPVDQCGDLLLRDRVGLYTYNYAVVVDDIRHKVNLIVRGTDLIHCTGRQLILERCLAGKRDTCYLHHPLVCDEDGKKLSNRHSADPLRIRRKRGDTSEQVIGDALFAAQLIKTNQPISLQEVPAIIIGDHHACRSQ